MTSARDVVSSIESRDILNEIYLDFFNNYLTVARYAECNGLTLQHATTLIGLARVVHESEHPEA